MTPADKFADFIQKHENEDTTRLLLNRGKWPDIDMDLAVNTLEGRKRIRKKLPTWYAQPALSYPDRLCTEQCSSEQTATFKASIARELGARRIADLTGGLGVDSWAFSQVAEAVLHNEMKPYLSQSVQRNLPLLGCNQVEYSQLEIQPENILPLLEEFHPDLVFMDPARRDDAGKKVFLIEDCRPDVLKLKELIFKECQYILLKLSPMADISMAAERCGNVRDLYVVSAEGECKELLLLLQRDWTAPYRLHVKEGEACIAFPATQESQTSPQLLPDLLTLESLAGKVLFEPGKSITKAGLFNTIGEFFGLYKLGRSTHLYIQQEASQLHRQQEASLPHLQESDCRIRDFGKCFRILEVLESGNKTVKYLSKTYPKAEVTAKNLPISSDALRKKLHCTSGSAIHIFATKVDTLQGSAAYFFVTEKIETEY